MKLGRTLSTLLVEVTSLDHTIKIRNTFANRIKRFDATPVSEKKSATPAEKFSKRFGFSEPVIERKNSFPPVLPTFPFSSLYI